MNRPGQSRGKTRRKGKGAPREDEVNALIGLYRAGDFANAAEAARAFTERWPKQAIGWNVLAAAREKLGDAEGAAKAYRRALKLEPENVEAQNNLANALRRAGQPEEALRACRKALALNADHIEAHGNLALILADLGRTQEALAACDRALALRPDMAALHSTRALLLQSLGRFDEAEKTLHDLLEREPRSVEAHGNLANLLRAAGRADEAEAVCQRLLELAPRDPGPRVTLGLIRLDHGDLEGAATRFRDALQLDPDAVPALHNLGFVLVRLGRFAEAEKCLRRVLEVDPRHAPTWQDLGNLLMDLGRLEEAESLHRRAVELRPDSPDAYRVLGLTLAVMGRRPDAEAAYRRALELKPEDAESWYHLSSAKRFVEDDPDLAAIEALLERDDLDDEARIFLHYAAVKAYDDIGGHADAVFAHCAEGGRLKRATLDYDVADDEAMFAAMARVFDADWLQRMAGAGDPTPAPVFIVGMPRSGTTLVEQILASHSAVHGAGEREDLERILGPGDPRRPFPDWMADMSPSSLTALGTAWREAVIDSAPPVERVTDKMPENFRFLGPIAAMLPNARIIHVLRDPGDICLSCYTRWFTAKAPFSYDLVELGRFYRAYEALMGHWRAVLPTGMLLEVRYEDLVDEPEAGARQLVAHCGLEWEPACLEFHRTERAVPTASLMQVRRPMYRDSIERWRPYAEHLKPLFETLGPLAPGRDMGM